MTGIFFGHRGPVVRQAKQIVGGAAEQGAEVPDCFVIQTAASVLIHGDGCVAYTQGLPHLLLGHVFLSAQLTDSVHGCASFKSKKMVVNQVYVSVLIFIQLFL